ncbi:MAG: hypothetical protein JXA14_21160 [Anaerolineae bacterium]|nr:hypothetical protein [Anaerolineae bacterium]
MNGDDQLLGIVKDGEFRPLAPRSVLDTPVRLTRIQMQAAQSPASAELDLTEYEGQAIMVQGLNAGGWVYSARVIDQAGAILTAVVQQVFGQSDEADSGQVKIPKAAA